MSTENKKTLLQNILELKKKLFSLKFKKSSGDLKDTSVIKKMKKDIARLFTKLNNTQE